MFSELRHHPRTHVVVRNESKLPPVMDVDYQTQHALAAQQQQQQYNTAEPVGRHHALYVARPLLAPSGSEFGNTYAPIKYDPALLNESEPADTLPPKPLPKTRTVYVQTDYRYRFALVFRSFVDRLRILLHFLLHQQ
jgi:hypothetical protein